MSKQHPKSDLDLMKVLWESRDWSHRFFYKTVAWNEGDDKKWFPNDCSHILLADFFLAQKSHQLISLDIPIMQYNIGTSLIRPACCKVFWMVLTLRKKVTIPVTSNGQGHFSWYQAAGVEWFRFTHSFCTKSLHKHLHTTQPSFSFMKSCLWD